VTTLERDMDVGIRELKASLSKYLRDVQDGQTLTVTDRGRPIALVVPFRGRSKLEQLIAEGRVTPAQSTTKPVPNPVKIGARSATSSTSSVGDHLSRHIGLPSPHRRGALDTVMLADLERC
jgi:prevent-host-death family protein